MFKDRCAPTLLGNANDDYLSSLLDLQDKLQLLMQIGIWLGALKECFGSFRKGCSSHFRSKSLDFDFQSTGYIISVHD